MLAQRLQLPEPDLTFFLDIDAREALARKGEFTSLETGHSGLVVAAAKPG